MIGEFDEVKRWVIKFAISGAFIFAINYIIFTIMNNLTFSLSFLYTIIITILFNFNVQPKVNR